MIFHSAFKFYALAFLGYAYDLVNPWRPRHDQVIRRILEAGLIEKWKERTWWRMKEEYQEELKRTGAEGIKFNIKPLISAMTVNDFQVYLPTLMLFQYQYRNCFLLFKGMRNDSFISS